MDLADAKSGGKARGGIARAARLSPEERSVIAKKAAAARWNDDLPQAVCGSPDRPLRIGDVELQCYVLEDGTRVLSQGGLLQALGRHRKVAIRQVGGPDVEVPPILQSATIFPFVSQEILEASKPIPFRTPCGVRMSGYRATLLPQICEVYLKARDAGALKIERQQRIAKQAEILVRALANVGIIALVDEVTGYQEVRARDNLARILEAFVAKELRPWVRTFPDNYYRELFRLRGLEYPKDTVKRPLYFGTLTNDIIYRRLAPGVLDELKRVTPRSESGRHKHRLFRWLTSDIGYPALREHLASTVTIMKLSQGWPDFMNKLDQIHPRWDTTRALPFAWDDVEDDGNGL